MVRFHSDWAYLEQEFGCSIRERFLMAVRSLDNPRAVTPFMVEHEKRRFGLFMHVEKGNVESARLPPDITPVYYRPYFTFEDSGNVHPSLLDALKEVAGSDTRVVMDRLAPLAIQREVATSFKVNLEDGAQLGTVSLRSVRCADIVTRLAAGRATAAGAARRLLERSPARDRLAPFLEVHADARFETLDRAMADALLDGLIFSSTLNLQEITGVPAASKKRPVAGFYVPGDKRAWVLESGRSADAREFPSPAAALKHVMPDGRIGIEEEDLPIGLAHDLGLETRDWQMAGTLMRRWRDENTLPDVPYYVIATRITRHAIEAALEFATAALQKKAFITEMDPYAVYLRSMREYAAAALPGAKVARTLTNFHTGRRTIFPANAAPYPVDSSVNTLKIDAGCLLFDSEGVLLGCSDIARTLSLSDSARQLYDVFRHAVRNVLIPEARAGNSGEYIHAKAVDAVWRDRERFGTNPLFVDLPSPAQQYARDVGHLLGKNNLAHLRLVHGDRQTLREGMIACCEYQWPRRGHAIAYEDTCVVTSEGGLNITSDEE